MAGVGLAGRRAASLHCSYALRKSSLRRSSALQLTVSLNFTAKKIASASSSHQLLLGQLLFASLQEPRAKKIYSLLSPVIKKKSQKGNVTVTDARVAHPRSHRSSAAASTTSSRRHRALFLLRLRAHPRPGPTPTTPRHDRPVPLFIRGGHRHSDALRPSAPSSASWTCIHRFQFQPPPQRSAMAPQAAFLLVLLAASSAAGSSPTSSSATDAPAASYSGAGSFAPDGAFVGTLETKAPTVRLVRHH